MTYLNIKFPSELKGNLALVLVNYKGWFLLEVWDQGIFHGLSELSVCQILMYHAKILRILHVWKLVQ